MRGIKVFFQASYSLKGMFPQEDRSLPQTVTFDEKTDFLLWLRDVDNRGERYTQLCCSIIQQSEPNSHVVKTLEALKEGQLLLDEPPQLRLPYYSIGEGDLINASGKVSKAYLPTLAQLPSKARHWLSEHQKGLSAQLFLFLRTLRWRTFVSGGHTPFSFIGFNWSYDRKNWTEAPRNFDFRITDSQGVATADDILAKTVGLMKSGQTEGFGHELLREAYTLVSHAPRSALLIGVSALETGIKSHITKLEPNAASLLEKIQSPPALTLLQEVLPALYKANGRDVSYIPLVASDSKYLRKWITQRNQIAHGAKQSVDIDKLYEFIIFIILGVSEDPKFDVLTSGAGGIQVEA
jgi:hypothetical protein